MTPLTQLRPDFGPVAAGRTRSDVLRVCAIGTVVLGHWLLTDITYRGGRLSGVDALPYVSWGRWLTLVFQVMPVFFLVGGYANAVSWTAHHARGQGWTVWVKFAAGPCGCCGRQPSMSRRLCSLPPWQESLARRRRNSPRLPGSQRCTCGLFPCTYW